jgi:hypothetical protein
MQTKSLVEQICQLNRRGVRIGLQIGEMGIFVWMTDRLFRRRVDHVINEQSAQGAETALRAWFASEAASLAEPSADDGVVLRSGSRGERWPLHNAPRPPTPVLPGRSD